MMVNVMCDGEYDVTRDECCVMVSVICDGECDV